MKIGGIIDIRENGVTDISVNAEETVYTEHFPLKRGLFFGLWALASSAGTPNIKIELELAPTEPATAQKEVAATTLFAVQSGDVIFDAINDKVAHVETVSPVPMSYGRFKLTGLTANPADATIALKLFQQDEF